MTNPVPALNWKMLANLRANLQEFKRQQQIFNQIVPQLTEAFVALIPLPNKRSLSTPTTNQTQGTVSKWLLPEEADVLKRLKDAAVDPNGGLKNVEAFAQLLNAITNALMEHWGSLPPEMQQQLVTVTQPMLDLLTPAGTNATHNVSIKFTHVSTRSLFSSRQLLSNAKTVWVLIQNLNKTFEHLNQLFVALLKLARTVQRLNDRDLKVAEFRRKLAAEPNWGRVAQLERNQAAIVQIQARHQKDEQMTQEEKERAVLEFELFKKIIDDSRAPGNKLYTNE